MMRADQSAAGGSGCDEFKAELIKAMEAGDPLDAQYLAAYIEHSYYGCLWERAASLLEDGTDLDLIRDEYRIEPSDSAAETFRAVMHAVPVPDVPQDEVRPVAVADWKVRISAHRLWVAECTQILGGSGLHPAG
jgi:hypothetical protein